MTSLITAAMLLNFFDIVVVLLTSLIMIGAAGMWWLLERLLAGFRNVVEARQREKQRLRLASTRILAEARIQRATGLAVSQLLAVAGSELTDPRGQENDRHG